MNQLILCLAILSYVPVFGDYNQGYDGWYNNLANPSWGGAGDTVIFDVPAAYADMTYLPAGQNRPNARVISNNVLSGPSGLPSYSNHTVLFAFFGQLVAYEVVHASDSSCPVELLKVPVPENDEEFRPNGTANNEYLPFVRSLYSKGTGMSPNNPRKPVNKVSSWIDGNFIYGRGEVWCNCMRSFVGGQLTTLNGSRNFPGLNAIRLPLDNFPSPLTHAFTAPESMWMFGDPHTHQNPGLASLALVWFRYHNYLADVIATTHPHWTDNEVFQAARKKVLAVLQHVVYDEWLPAFLGEDLPQYSGYKPHVQPAISALFESAAFRIGHSHIPAGIYVRNSKCAYENPPIRLCNSYWHSQEILSKYGLEKILLGMSSQISEREDHVVVEDLRGKCFGPLHFSRHDLTVMTIMRGRDHGLPDYNTARKAYGLPEINRWKDINPWLYSVAPKAIDNLRRTYNDSLENVDVFPAGLMEGTPAGPGPLFRAILKDQFTRIRDGDRYWFENTQSGILTNQEREEIQRMTFKDVIMLASDIGPDDLQDNVFVYKSGDPCPQPRQLRSEDLETCTPHQGFDYFEGSEVSYIMAFTCLGLVPFLCVLAAYLVAKCKDMKIQKAGSFLNFTDYGKSETRQAGRFHVLEWTGHKKEPNQLKLSFVRDSCSLKVCNMADMMLRTTSLKKDLSLKVWLASDKRDFLMINMPREYDLCFRFHSEAGRQEFVTELKEMLKEHARPLHQNENTYKHILERAVTRVKREELLTCFFKSVFAEAHSVNEIKHPDDYEISQCKEIVECELTREEFSEALCIRPDSLFVDQMFAIIDRDGNGYISFRELLYAVLLFAKGSCEDKLYLLFLMYDRDRRGSLTRNEMTEMISSMVEMANTNLTQTDVIQLIDQMFVSAGLEHRDVLEFKDFASVLSGQMHMFWDVCVDWKGTRICFPKTKSKKMKKIDPKMLGLPGRNEADMTDATMRTPRAPTKTAIALKTAKHYLENHKQQMIYLFIFFTISAYVFSERFYYYAVEQEHMGTRSVAGYGVSLTRGAAAGMCFTFSLILLTVCQNTITKLRETVLNLYVPFDSIVAFHKVVAWTALFFTVIHILGYCFNFYHIVTQPVQSLCILDEIVFRSDYLPDINFWLFQNLTGFTGVLLVIVVCIMYVFATQTTRTHIFSSFWITHKLYYVLYILTLLHGCSRIIQDPLFPAYFIGPATLFLGDKLISVSRRKREMSAIAAELLPSDVTKLEFKRPPNFEYRSGQWIRLACAALGQSEYHSLTLTSAPHEDNLSVHVRAVGPWTRNFRKVFNPDNLIEGPYPKLFLDGPFGAGQQDWFRYDVSVLVGGGIGVTPYASILKDYVHMMSVKNTFRLKCKKLYFIWVTASQKHFEWLIDIIKQVEDVDKQGMVETHIFITQFFQRFDLRTTIMYICEEHFQRMSGRSMFTGLSAQTHFGRPNFVKVLESVHAQNTKVRKIGVFCCGPPGLTKSVQHACYETSKSTNALFENHFENF